MNRLRFVVAIVGFRAGTSTRLALYQIGLAGAAVVLVTVCVVAGWRAGDLAVVGALAAAAAVAERGRVRITETADASISLLPTVFAAAVFGPVAAMIIASASFLGELPLLMDGARRAHAVQVGKPYLRWGVYTASRSVTAGCAGLAAVAAHGSTAQPVVGILLATAAAALTAEGLDVGFLAVTSALRGGEGLLLARLLAPVVAGYASLYTPVVAVLAVAYVEFSPLILALFFVPALAAQRLFGLYQQQRQLAQGLGEANELLEAVNLSFATALVATLDARDRYTAGHSAAVAVYARDIAKRMGLTAEEQQRAHLAGLVHDIGKIGLPAGLLEKPGALTLEERRHMERHSAIGERILRNVQTYNEVAAIVRHHHERYDGQGYPDGLVGEEIPLLARVIAVADAYNAMTSDRPYRDALPIRMARLRLVQSAENQFDPTVVAAFEAILAGSSGSYQRGCDPKFRLDVTCSSAAPVRTPALGLALAHAS